jgi:uncharacterized membrane protein YdjX (TVP38/TMEM64 family)
MHDGAAPTRVGGTSGGEHARGVPSPRDEPTGAGVGGADGPRRRGVVATLRRLGPAGPVALVMTILPALGTLAVAGLVASNAGWLRAHHDQGLLIHLGAFAVLGGLAVVPTNLNAIVAGWAFGFADGFAVALAGTVAASAVGYAIGSYVSRERVTGLIGEHPKWRAVHRALVGGGFLKTAMVVMLWRLSPAVPFALTNLLLSSVRVRFGPYLLGSALGVTPRTALLTYAASRMTELDWDAGYSPWMFVAGAGVTVAVLVILGLIARRALSAATAETAA